MYLNYTICSHYHDTTKVAYCVPNLHNMLPLPKCYQGSILCTLTTQYAPIIILLPHYHTTKVAYCEPYLHNMPHYHITIKVAYCVPYLHNMLPLS